MDELPTQSARIRRVPPQALVGSPKHLAGLNAVRQRAGLGANPPPGRLARLCQHMVTDLCSGGAEVSVMTRERSKSTASLPRPIRARGYPRRSSGRFAWLPCLRCPPCSTMECTVKDAHRTDQFRHPTFDAHQRDARSRPYHAVLRILVRRPRADDIRGCAGVLNANLRQATRQRIRRRSR